MNKKTIFLLIGGVIIVSGLGLVYGYFNQSKNPLPKKITTSTNKALNSTSEKIGYIDVSPQKASDLIKQMPDLVIIDVSPNYAKGHLPGAINYYVGDGSLDKAIPTLDKSLTYLVYCHVDSAAIAGAQKLVDAGFTKVYRLEGNYSGWVEAGFPIEIPEN